MDNAPPLHPEAMPDKSMTLALNMESARKRAIDEAYAIATQSRPDTAYWAWVCPTVELVSMPMGTASGRTPLGLRRFRDLWGHKQRYGPI
ncbi:MAG: hypothetical protein ACYCT0_06465 [Sulfobacillus sp.]